MAGGQVVSCPHMVLRNLQIDINLDIINDSRKCSICHEKVQKGGDLWLCLFRDCYTKVCCGEDDHRETHTSHYKKHTLFVAVRSMRVWCTVCKAFINVQGNQGTVREEDADDSDDDEEEIVDDGECRMDEAHLKANGLTGLSNQGNTCYMNAALQALSNTPPLTQFFLECGETAIEAVSRDSAGQKRLNTLSKAYHWLMQEMWDRKKRGFVAPNGVLYGIRTVNPTFRGNMQQDTQEFLRSFMDNLHEELKVKVVEPPPAPMCECSLPEQDDEEMSDADNAEASVPNVTVAAYGEPHNDVRPPTNESEAGGASSQSEGEEYETCDSGVSERSSLSEEATSLDAENNRPLSNPPSPLPAKSRIASASAEPPRTPSATSIRRKAQTQFRSIISDVFDGKILSSVECLTCNRISTRVEAFQDLSLPIPNRDHLNILHQGSVNINTTLAKCSEQLYSVENGWLNWLWGWLCSWFWGPTVSLHDCLSAFFSADELKGDNMYSCERCKKLRNGIKFSKLLQLPEVLCIHLKRFRHENIYASKITSHVTFPIEGLDLRPYLHKHCVSTVSTYDLIAVICHHGQSFNNGHYTTYALNHKSERWYEFDDQCVTKVSEMVVRSCEAYVLFYRKRNKQANQVRNRAYNLMQRAGSKEPLTEVYAVSKRWMTRFSTFAEPGPIDNTDFLCHHSRILPGRERDLHHYITSMPAPVWDYLYEKYGGGPVCTLEDMVPCETCANNNLSPEMNRSALEREFWRLEQEMLESPSMSSSNVLTVRWFNRWNLWIKGKSVEHPGPIDNDELLIDPRKVVANGEYRKISKAQWDFLLRMYGGGPEVLLVLDQNQLCIVPAPLHVSPPRSQRDSSSDQGPTSEEMSQILESIADEPPRNRGIRFADDSEPEQQPITVSVDVHVSQSGAGEGTSRSQAQQESVAMEVEEEPAAERTRGRSRVMTRSAMRAARSRKPIHYRTLSTSMVDIRVDPDGIQAVESVPVTDNDNEVSSPTHGSMPTVTQGDNSSPEASGTDSTTTSSDL